MVIAIALLVSLFIYLFYRTEKTVVNVILIKLISFETFSSIRQLIVNTLPLPNVVVYSLPEGLWIFCITLTSKSYYIEVNRRRIDCIFVPLAFCLTLEILQLFHIANGRFDYLDIGFSVLFWLLGVYTLSSRSEKQNIFIRINSGLVVCLATYCIVYLSHVNK